MLTQAFIVGGWINPLSVGVARLISGDPTWSPAAAAADGALNGSLLITNPAGGYLAAGPNSFALPPGTPPPGSCVNTVSTDMGSATRVGRFYSNCGSIAVSANGTIWITSGSNNGSYDETGTKGPDGTAWEWTGTDWVPLSMPSFITNPYPHYVQVGWRSVVAGDGDQVFFAGEICWQDSVEGTTKNYKAAMYENGVWTALGPYSISTVSPGVTCVGMIRLRNGHLLAAFCRDGNYSTVYIEEWTGASWTGFGIFNDFNVAYVTPLAEDEQGNIWVAGMDSNASVPLVYMWNGVDWIDRGNLTGYTDCYLNVVSVSEEGKVFVAGWSPSADACLFEWDPGTMEWLSLPVPDSPDVEIYALIPIMVDVADPQPDNFVSEPVTVNIYDYNPDEPYTIKRAPIGIAPPGQEVEYLWNLVPGASSGPAPSVKAGEAGPLLVLERLKPGRFLFRFTAQWGNVAVYEQDFWINVRPKPGQES